MRADIHSFVSLAALATRFAPADCSLLPEWKHADHLLQRQVQASVAVVQTVTVLSPVS